MGKKKKAKKAAEAREAAIEAAWTDGYVEGYLAGFAEAEMECIYEDKRRRTPGTFRQRKLGPCATETAYFVVLDSPREKAPRDRRGGGNDAYDEAGFRQPVNRV